MFEIIQNGGFTAVRELILISVFFNFVIVFGYGNTGGGGGLPYNKLIEMCHWMGSHFDDWSDFNGVAFSTDLLEWGRKFSDFWGK